MDAIVVGSVAGCVVGCGRCWFDVAIPPTDEVWHQIDRAGTCGFFWIATVLLAVGRNGQKNVGCGVRYGPTVSISFSTRNVEAWCN